MTLASLNSLTLSDSGVFAAPDVQPFAYSDGEATEAVLAKILTETQDLSSESQELEAQITDWPTEYHLTAKRGNLLRALNLDSAQKLLELGCGCGAITRFLGEQESGGQPKEIDAVEGSMARAELAALRCRGLDNVTIHCANFNDLAFPDSHYDLVLLVGVTEYAGRFSSASSDQEALQELLLLARKALKPGGVVLIAIENRLGLKYLLGASEDHYGEPWVGVEGYAKSTGIRTYSQPEWMAEIKKAGFANVEFAFPFPDYKVPTAVIDQASLHSDAALSAISKTRSRDYLRSFSIQHEDRVWQGMHESGELSQISNSFLIMLSDQQSAIDSLSGFGVCEFESETYNWHERATDPNTQRLQNKLANVTEQSQQLQAELDLIKQSRSYRLVNAVRSLLGRT